MSETSSNTPPPNPTPAFRGGSEWRRWDLHVHSPMSILSNQYPLLAGGEPDWSAYLDRLERSGLAVIGITDYFTIDGYKAIREFQRRGRLSGIRVIPNVELRLSNFAGGRRLNLHVLFSDELDPQVIEEHFLHDLDFVFENEPQQPGRTRKLKTANLEAMGKQLKAQNAAFSQSDLQVGAMTAVVDVAKIHEILSGDRRFEGKYLIALPDENLSLMDWAGQDHVVRQTLLQGCDMIFGSNPKTIQWCLAKEPYKEGQEAFIREFKSLKPCLHGSDAHDFDRIGAPCAKRGVAGHTCGPTADCEMRHCWVKADPTFEGLRQVVYEPEARVRIQADDPTPVRSSYSLSRFSASETRINADLTMADIDLPLNHGLVAVAGGKGSGKTALLDLIAHSFSDRRYVDNKNSFVRRIASDNPVMQISLTFADGSEFAKRVLDADVYDSGEITCIAQGELEDRIGDKQKLGAHIRDLVLGSPQVKDSVRTFELRQAEARARAAKKSLDALQEEIQALEDKTSPTVEAEVLKAEQMLRKDLADTQAKIDALTKKVGEARAETAQETQTKLNDLETDRNVLLKLRESLDALERFTVSALPDVIAVAKTINASLGDLGLTPRVAVPAAYPSTDISTARGAVEDRLRETLQSIEAASQELGSFEEGIREHAGLLRAKADTSAKVENLEKQRAELSILREQLAELEERRRTAFRQMIEYTLSQRDIYNALFASFADKKQQVLHEVVFTPEVSYDQPGLEDAVTTVVDGRQVRDVSDELQHIHTAMTNLADGKSSDIEAVITAIETLTPSLSTRMKSTRALGRATLYRVLWDNYLAVRPSIRYKSAPLDRLSLGQKATVLVKVYLAQGTTPIIIDSHDEHMDNQFIMDELVTALRQAKEYRQIIVASNNGNVVVNSDAEQVVLATFTGGRISYTSGALEDPTVRDAALRVLEGGAEAFRRRRVKYRVGG